MDGARRTITIEGASNKLFLILDKLRVDHAKPVKAWLLEYAEAIEVFYLPSYRLITWVSEQKFNTAN